jgi:hypothetical protein
MIELKASTRTIKGKSNKGLLAKEIVPGSISRANLPTIMIQADQISLIPVTRIASSELVNITVDEKESYTTVISELLINPLTNKVDSFSMTELTDKSHVTVTVPIVTEGVSPAVKNNLGVLIMNRPSLKITASLKTIVDKIVIDISKLADVGSRLLVSDLPGIENIKLASEKDRTLTVVTIRPLQKVEVFTQQVAAAADAAATAATDAATGAAPAVAK